MGYPELKRAVREQYAHFRPSVVLIEDKASGTQLIQELVQEGLYAVTRYQPQSDKVMRMHAQTAMIENGFVHLPDAAPWLAQYLHEITTFPTAGTTTRSTRPQLLDWFKRGSGPSSNAGIFEYYRQRTKELRRGQGTPGRLVRLRAPAGVGAVQLLSGTHRNVSANGRDDRGGRRAAIAGGLGHGRGSRFAGVGRDFVPLAAFGARHVSRTFALGCDREVTDVLAVFSPISR